MAKPIVVAKPEGHDWVVGYIDTTLDEGCTMSVIGSPTIDDALREAHSSLDANEKGRYEITSIERVEIVDNDQA